MPSVLVEVGFLTNKKEGQYLNSEKGQQEMATTISKAILNYRKLLAASVSRDAINQNVPKDINTPTTKIEDKKVTPPINANTNTKGIVFKVQIAASARLLELNKENFKGLKGLSVQKGDKLYRYFYGQSNHYKAAKRLKDKAIKAGYKHAFVVAFKDGVKMNISDAISQQ